MKDIIGLLVLAWPLMLLAIIALTFLVLVPMAVAYAKRTGRSKWRWGIGAFLLVYLPIFWDWLPTVAVHQYYCAKESGFWVYKTLDQWKAENPGVMEGLVANKGEPFRHETFDVGRGEKNTYFVNDRFNWIVTQQDIFNLMPIIRTERLIKDIQKDEILARYVDFGTGNSVKNTIGPPGPLKFWLRNRHCWNGEGRAMSSANFFKQFKGAEK